MNYKRINKPTARKMFNRGYTLYLLPCKVSDSVVTNTPHDYDWLRPLEISLPTSNHEANQFDRTVNEFEYYNCNAELGYYAHYYVSEEDYIKYKEEVKWANFITVISK